MGNPREQLRKAAITTSVLTTANGGVLERQDADAFISKVRDESKLLSVCTVKRVDHKSGKFSLLDFPNPVTRAATENEAAANVTTYTPTHSAINYDTVKARSAIDLTGDAEEDNIEGSKYRSTVVGAIEKRVRSDIEQLAIEGDTSTAGSSDEALLLQINDGWHKLTGVDDGAHVFDAGNKRISFKMLTELKRNLPTKYWGDLEDYMFLASPAVVADLAYEVADRSTDVGDRQWMEDVQYRPHGIPLVGIPKIPVDLALTGTDSTGSFIWLVNPKNFVCVIQREVKIEYERVPRRDLLEVTLFTRTDFVVQNADAVAKCTSVIVDIAGTRY